MRTIGGVADHVHLLIGLRATHCLADVLRDIKSASSEWVHQDIGAPAFTVSASKIPEAKDYIARQAGHHRKKTFQEEYVEFLQRSGVEYDPRYLW